MLSGEDDTILISLNVAIKDANIVSIHPKPFSPALFLRQNYDEEKHLSREKLSVNTKKTLVGLKFTIESTRLFYSVQDSIF